jgi:hypothetical protein
LAILTDNKSKGINESSVSGHHDELAHCLSLVCYFFQIRGERIEVLSALMHKEVTEITVKLNGLCRVVDLHSGIIDELLLLRVELNTVEGIVVGFH